MVCLDSDFMINFFRKKPHAVNKIKKLKKNEVNLSTTTINTFEMYRGFIDSKKHTPEIFENFLNNVNILHFDFESSKKAAEIFEYLRVRGELLDLADIMIAATVITNNEILLTENLKHFSRIPNLKIEEI